MTTQIKARIVGTSVVNGHVEVSYSYKEYEQTLNIPVNNNFERTIEQSAPRKFFIDLTTSAPSFDLSPYLDREFDIDLHPPTYHKDTASTASTGMHTAGILYSFDAGGVLGEHTHKTDSDLHDITVVSGQVLVRKQSGDVICNPNDVIAISIDEPHSVIAIEKSETLHRYVKQGRT